MKALFLIFKSITNKLLEKRPSKEGLFSLIKNMNITIINDCRDANASGRQITRVTSLLGSQVSFIGVTNDLEAAGNLVDTLDALEENPGVVLVNVAPRNGKAKKWKNGTPFGYFWHKKILILSSIDGFTLSLVKKLELTKFINVLEVPRTLDQLIAYGVLSKKLKNSIARTQFRSYEFLPRVAAFLVQGKKLQSTKLNIKNIPDMPLAIWWIDNFGNCKTTLLSEDMKYKIYFSEKFNALTHLPRLKDVPSETAAIITGSSGLGEKRFLEIVVQGGSAAKKLNISVGELNV